MRGAGLSGRLKDREEDAGFEPGQSPGNAGIEGKQPVGASGWCTAGEDVERGQGQGWSAVGQRAVAGRLSSTLKSLTKAGLNDQKFHLIGQIKK